MANSLSIMMACCLLVCSLYFGIHNKCFCFREKESFESVVDFTLQMDKSAARHKTASTSFVYLRAGLPLRSLDKQIARLLQQETSDNKPVVIFAGIRGNPGRIIDIIPTQSKETTNPVLVMVDVLSCFHSRQFQSIFWESIRKWSSI